MKKRKNLQNLMYLPALGLMIVFIVYPLFRGFLYSFYKWNGYSQNMAFVGFKNYLDMMGNQFFGIAFWNTVLYAVLGTLLQEVLGIAFAIFLNSRFTGRIAVRTVIYLPVIISALLIGYMMTFLFQYHYGVFNEILQWFGMKPIDWLRDPGRGRIIISLVTGWHYTGGSMIIFMAGLQNIPDMYIEAAKLDGATKWQLFSRITLPLLQPAVASTVLLNMVGGLKIYDSIVSLTNGGPVQKTNSLSTLISYTYFTSEKAGYASAIGMFQFVFIFIISFFINRYFAGKEVEY
ncbi:MAG: sugar ABC transporter permease [Kineothrix sp.]|nr:sugar ABC transporter permease [Kineothrix sp.]